MKFQIFKKKENLWVYFVVVLIVIFFFNLFSLSQRIKEISFFLYEKIIFPVKERIFAFNRSIELEKLKKENLKLLSEHSEFQRLKKENEALKKALKLKSIKHNQKIALAQKINKDIFNDTILINAGKREGVLPKDIVITPENVLVGQITKVYEKYSEVSLISRKDFSFDVKVLNKKIYGIAKGQGGFKMSLAFVPKDSDLKNGDVLVTAEIGGVFPAGLLVGKVYQVEFQSLNSFVAAKIKPFISDLNPEYLIVVR